MTADIPMLPADPPPEYLFVGEGIHMENGVVSRWKAATDPLSSDAVKAFGPVYRRADPVYVRPTTKEQAIKNMADDGDADPEGTARLNYPELFANQSSAFQAGVAAEQMRAACLAAVKAEAESKDNDFYSGECDCILAAIRALTLPETT